MTVYLDTYFAEYPDLGIAFDFEWGVSKTVSLLNHSFLFVLWDELLDINSPSINIYLLFYIDITRSLYISLEYEYCSTV